MSRGNKPLGSDTIVARHSVNNFMAFRSVIVAYDLLSGWWQRLEISKVIGVVASILAGADNECNICIADLCKVMSSFYYREFPPTQSFVSSFRRLDKHILRLKGIEC
jgi:hypothetical protein